MRLVNFTARSDGRTGLGALVDDEIADLRAVADDVLVVAAGGVEALEAARRAFPTAPRLAPTPADLASITTTRDP